MVLDSNRLIGKETLLLLLLQDRYQLPHRLTKLNWKYCRGKVGSMDGQKVVAAVETAARNQKIVSSDLYRESHALYHAIIEAMTGVTRGSNQIGAVLRTVGLQFAVVRGNPYSETRENEWIAVAFYGTIGAPVKGFEHEAIGLGINHI